MYYAYPAHLELARAAAWSAVDAWMQLALLGKGIGDTGALGRLAQ